MQIELPIIDNGTIVNRCYGSEHVFEARPGPGTTVNEVACSTTSLEFFNGQTRLVALSYEEYRQRGYDAQFIYTYNEGTSPV